MPSDLPTDLLAERPTDLPTDLLAERRWGVDLTPWIDPADCPPVQAEAIQVI